MNDVQISTAGMRELEAAVHRALADKLAPAIMADADRGYEAASEAIQRRLGPQLETWDGPNGELRVGVRGPDAWLADIVERGSRAHLIQAKGKALRFTIGGLTLFRRSVHHPGTVAHHVIRLAATRKRALR